MVQRDIGVIAPDVGGLRKPGTLRSQALPRVLAGAVLVCALASGACSREQLDNAAASVKHGAERVKNELPAATQRARDELAAARDAVKGRLEGAGDKLEGASDKVRDGAETLREKAP